MAMRATAKDHDLRPAIADRARSLFSEMVDVMTALVLTWMEGSEDVHKKTGRMIHIL